MGWNGSNSGSSAVGRSVPDRRKVGGSVGRSVPDRRGAQGTERPTNAPSFKKGIIAGLIVVIGAGLAAFIIGRGGSPSRPQEAKKPATKQIAEVTPQIVTQAVEEVVTPPPESVAEARRTQRRKI